MLAKMNLLINQDKTCHLDIDEIFDIKVFVGIEHKQYLRITARKISRDIGDYCSEGVNLYCKRIIETNEIISEVHLEKIIDILNNLKFNRIKGEFYLGDDTDNTTIEELEEKNQFYKKFNSNIKIRKTYEDCSICFEPTMCKGKCGHFCCYPCWNKIEEYICDECKENNCECDCDDELCCQQRCPVCRQKLSVA